MKTPRKNNSNSLCVGFDAKRAVSNATGLGNYSRYAISSMLAAFPQLKAVLYSPKADKDARLKDIIESPNVSLRTYSGHMGAAGRALWRSFGVTSGFADDNIDLYHGLSNELPLNIASAGIPSVLTMHDIIYRRFPDDYRSWDRTIYDFKYSRSAEGASRIIAVSQRTKDDIVNDYNIDPAKIDVVYQGIHPIFRGRVGTGQKAEARARYSLPEKYIISVGTVSPRKNQMLAVAALAQMPDDIKLVIVGGEKRDYADRIARKAAALHVTDRIIRLKDVPLYDLPALYAGASASIYPSRYEGFGLPVVEALACGTPVVACTGSCLEEAGGRGAVYVDPDDVDAAADALTKMYTEVIYHDKYARAGLKHIADFNDAEFAKKTMAVYRKAILSEIMDYE